MLSARELQSWKLKDLLKLDEDLKEAIDTRKKTEAKEVRQELSEMAQKRGFRLEDVFGRALGGKGHGKGYKASMAPKFANPEDRTQTWVGKGRKPNWMVTRLSKGATLEDFRI